ncbi:MAG TPA: response regulator transcription factor [Candidatus Acidoferrum sp.]|nr:response regulator transcription factor [Candidatus Acidoferrum sp.]
MAKLRQTRVLLADDFPRLVEVVRSLLETEFEILGCVDNGESLIEAAMRLHPDVIVTDISMPRLSGLGAVDRLRESGCSSKVVFLTAHSDPDFIDAAFRTGAVAYVLKTSMATDLLFAIQEALAGRVFVSLQGIAAQNSREPGLRG